MAVPGRASVFTYESKVHPNHVLLSLEEQRQQDVLCDVTLVTSMGQSFRAHRSVLASCSEYFSQRISSLSGQNAVITLPPEVTAAGFEPLLKFAYTSKLFIGTEDVGDIQTCVSALGFRDLDGACFDFLLPKFLSSTKGSAPKKTCCKKKCKKSLPKDVPVSDEVLLDAREVKPVADSSHQQEVPFQCSDSDAIRSQNIVCPVTPVIPFAEIARNDKTTQCPKYRKFQMACGKDTDKNQPKPVMKHNCSSPCSSNTESGSCLLGVSKQVEDLFDSESGKFHPVDVNKNVELPKITQLEMLENEEPVCKVKGNNECKDDWSIRLASPECLQNVSERMGSLAQKWLAGENYTFNMAQKQCKNAEDRITDRLMNSKENTKKRYGSLANDEAMPSTSSLEGLHFQLSKPLQDLEQSTSGWQCPKSSECEGASQSGLSSVNSGDDSDAEAYSEAYARERARQVQLPFPVEQIVEMSRNDFQELLDKQNLTREQLELVRDMRRRSKNRQAAKRCRKRKLDCIYNLQCEINKLKSEREMLIQERSRLSQLRLKTCHTMSALCQRVYAGAELPPEQLQHFANFNPAECPLTSCVPLIDSLLSSQQQQSSQLFPGRGIDDAHCPNPATTQDPQHNGNTFDKSSAGSL